MNETINIVRLRQPGEIDDPLTDILKAGARQLLARAVELEAEVFLASMQHLKLARRAGPTCAARARPRARSIANGDRAGRGQPGEGARSRRGSGWRRAFASLRRFCRCGRGGRRAWMRLLPVLYLRGISTGDFQEALGGPLGQGRAEPVAGSHLPADGRSGRASTSAGKSATCRAALRAMCGPMASSCRHAWKTTASACWC